jgi:hypothetical protein
LSLTTLVIGAVVPPVALDRRFQGLGSRIVISKPPSVSTTAGLDQRGRTHVNHPVALLTELRPSGVHSV